MGVIRIKARSNLITFVGKINNDHIKQSNYICFLNLKIAGISEIPIEINKHLSQIDTSLE